MKQILLIISLLLALPSFGYEFKVSELFPVQDDLLQEEASSWKKKKAENPVLFIQTDILDLETGDLGMQIKPVEGGYLVELWMNERSSRMNIELKAPGFMPFDLSFKERWGLDQIYGVRVERAGKDPSDFNPNHYSLRIKETEINHILVQREEEGWNRGMPCLIVNTDVPLAYVSDMFNQRRALFENTTTYDNVPIDGNYKVLVRKRGAKLKDILTPEALEKVQNRSADDRLRACGSGGPYIVEIEW